MERKRDEIIKALECVSGAFVKCKECIYYHERRLFPECRELAAKSALIKELTEENERLMKALNTDISIVRVSRGSGKTAHLREVLRIKADAIRADTVRKMRERLTTFFAADDTIKYSEVDAEYINSQIIKISKEMEEI